MKRFIRFFIEQHTLTQVILIVVIVFGVIGLKSLKTSFFAPVDPKQISIQLSYPGASPQEIEEGVVLPIEDELKGLLGIDEIQSTSSENVATLSISVKKGYDTDTVLQDVKNKVTSIASLPTDLEPPIIYQLPTVDFAIRVALSGPVPLSVLKQTAVDLEKEWRTIDGISLIEIEGAPDEEIQISVSPEALKQYDMSFQQLAAVIQSSDINMTGGQIRSDQEEFLIRARAQKRMVSKYQDIVVKQIQNSVIRLGDVATVTSQWADHSSRVYSNNKPAVILNVQKTLDEDILFITQTIRDYIQTFNESHQSIEASVVRDGSVVLKQRMSLLVKNGLFGFALVLLSLSLMIDTRLAFWVACGIPISFLGLFIVGGLSGLTINVISLFGMIVVVGILVDDGIVVAENIHQHVQEGKSAIDAAVDGCMEVLPSVTAAIVTTVIAFSPFFILDGRISEIISNLAFVVIVTLIISWFEVMIILPGHLYHTGTLLAKESTTRLDQLRQRILAWLKEGCYDPILRWALLHPYKSLAVSIVLFMITIFGFKAGIIKATFFPFIDSDTVTIHLELPRGATFQQTKSILDRMEQQVWDVNEEFRIDREDSESVILNVLKDIKSDFSTGSLRVQLLDGETRDLESFYISQAIRDKIGVIPEAKSVTIGSRVFFGEAISILLIGDDIDAQQAFAAELSKRLNQFEKVKDVKQNVLSGSREVVVSLLPTAEYYGLTEGDIMNQIRHRFFGIQLNRFQEGTDDIKVWLRFPEMNRYSIYDLQSLQINVSPNVTMPLGELVDLSIQRGVASIDHINGKRQTKITASLANQKDPLPPILKTIETSLMADLLETYPSVSIDFSGQKRETSKTAESARWVIPATFFLMFCTIVLAFSSYLQAVLVMVLIPFGLIGAAWGHVIHGISINMLSMFGLLALTGIIVNDSIVLVNRFNRHVKEGMSIKEAIYQAGLARFRAIFLTSITTIFGLAPLILETSRQAQFLIPMAISVAYGLFFATSIILVLMPVLLDLTYRRSWIRKRAFDDVPYS